METLELIRRAIEGETVKPVWSRFWLRCLVRFLIDGPPLLQSSAFFLYGYAASHWMQFWNTTGFFATWASSGSYVILSQWCRRVIALGDSPEAGIRNFEQRKILLNFVLKESASTLQQRKQHRPAQDNVFSFHTSVWFYRFKLARKNVSQNPCLNPGLVQSYCIFVTHETARSLWEILVDTRGISYSHLCLPTYYGLYGACILFLL